MDEEVQEEKQAMDHRRGYWNGHENVKEGLK